ncbi:MAG TPA: hypothetical protein VFB84_06300 [Micromonosporaceae bacterium]|nr:hypothetical protein [Micromonosporaceae bacterium]
MVHLVHIVDPRDAELLLPDDVQLLAQLLDETDQCVRDEPLDGVRWPARLRQDLVVTLARAVVVVGQQVARWRWQASIDKDRNVIHGWLSRYCRVANDMSPMIDALTCKNSIFGRVLTKVLAPKVGQAYPSGDRKR